MLHVGLVVALTASLPTSVKVNTATPKYAVKAVATAGGSTHDGLTTVGAKTVEGTATATASIDDAGTKIPVTVPTTVAKYTVPAGSGPLTLNASGSTPSIKFTKVGTAKVSVTALKLNLIARDSSGKPVQLGKTTDSDKSKDTFDVTCALSPTTQSTTLASIEVTS